MQNRSKVYLSIAIAVIIVVAAITATTIYLGIGANGNGCNESTTAPSKYNMNADTFTEVALSMESGCKAVLYVNWNGNFPATTNASTLTFDMTNTNGSYGAFVGVFVGAWYVQHTEGFQSGIKLIQNNVINVSVNPQTLTTANKTYTTSCGFCYHFDFNYTITIQTANSTKGFYVMYLPSDVWVPLAVGYSISQINMTKDYPDFGNQIPPRNLLGSVFGTSIVRIGGATLGAVE